MDCYKFINLLMIDSATVARHMRARPFFQSNISNLSKDGDQLSLRAIFCLLDRSSLAGEGSLYTRP